MMARKPRDWADSALSLSFCGVRWALTTWASQAMPNSSRVRAACSSVGQSDALPMMMPTIAFVLMREKR